ncbi:unnamed protein product [marine sediment metagenome]|uniref:Uncharacterized protein n=1 Tax=marine sediment metagenome TaxID=412755 RepID=X1KM00_9ZZZZ
MAFPLKPTNNSENFFSKSLTDKYLLKYEVVLKLDPPQMAEKEDLKLVEKYTPRLFTNPKEFFKLKDLVVVIHPEKPVIAYNLFWEDDIDYPGDNDPSDHEVAWIEFNKNKGEVTGVYTYFHKAILSTEEAVKDANLHNQRARINVEWGGHGSLPLRWEKLPISCITLPIIKTKIRTSKKPIIPATTFFLLTII